MSVQLPEEIQKYYQGFPMEIQDRMQKMREIALEIFGDCQECISYGIPTFRKNKKNVFHYGAFKKHIGWYPGGRGVAFFISKHPQYSFSKGCIRVNHTDELNFEELKTLLIWCLK